MIKARRFSVDLDVDGLGGELSVAVGGAASDDVALLDGDRPGRAVVVVGVGDVDAAHLVLLVRVVAEERHVVELHVAGRPIITFQSYG